MPAPVPASRWHFDSRRWPRDDLVAAGADLSPATLLAAYRSGVFPMPLGEVRPMVWWSPLQRGVLEPTRLRVTRSLHQSVRRLETTVDAAFDQVITACADPDRPGAWIDDDVVAAYRRLHDLGWAHSVEAWGHDGQLAGGLYGVGIGGLFAGESMFYRQRDASKVALVRLVELLSDEYVAGRLIDVQWCTPHLATLGV
ncbi:MAG: leucyl/phenylalanyl-tRNA--protein transferase, partial [Nocardioidaceae bacterium]